MGLKGFLYRLNFKKLLALGDGERKRRLENGRQQKKSASWMAPVSHGYHVVDSSFDPANSCADDLVKVQREQTEDGAEVWFFGIVDHKPLAHALAKYLHSNLFNANPKTSKLRRKSKQSLRKAYISGSREGITREKGKERRMVSAASAIVICGEKLVMANMGAYRVVVCKDGEAHQLGTKRSWSRRFVPGAIRLAKLRISAFQSRNTERAKSSEVIAGEESIDSRTEFVILGSEGIWEVMKNQEAVNLIAHLEDPQEAAECLAKEALNRMSKTNISCIVIRFD